MRSPKSLKSLFRRLLWKLCRRDYLVLNPDWAALQRQEGYAVLGSALAARERLLPMSYNYHTGQPWRLEYHLRGNGPGTLCYALSAPGKGAFAEARFPTKLPFTWTVQLEAQGALLGNGQPLSIVPGRMIPKDTLWLVGHFEFQSDAQGTFRRRAGHRVKLSARATTEDYFTGAIYEDYEQQPGIFPQQILERVGLHHPLRGKLLDVGCATGLLVQEALAQGLDAEGIDVSAWAVEKANARTGGRCRVLDLDSAEATDFPHPYDIITLHSVIEHLVDPARALRLLFEITQPGGVVYLQTLNADSLMHRLLEKNWAGYTDYTHQSPWLTADGLEAMAREIGFELLHLKRYGVWNDNGLDEAWKSFAALIQLQPAGALLEDQFGDFVEMILRAPRP
jgi:2-polyprenyl-3-methyl-5-hydroxy-6-metoxy-1,4-benzoquinol methylase